jgi:hypothetical protein
MLEEGGDFSPIGHQWWDTFIFKFANLLIITFRVFPELPLIKPQKTKWKKEDLEIQTC